MYTLEMADGSTVQVSMAGVGQLTGLWIHAHGMNLMEAFMVFSNPAKTAVMSITYDETIMDRFEGYTNLVSVSVCEDFIKIGLERAE